MLKILIIDDDQTTRSLLERILQQQGYSVYTASDGETGVKIAFEIQPALIICDWVMQGLTGLEVCQKIKADLALSITFFILLTLRNSTDDCVEGLDAGADEFLAKPINSHELKARVRAGLRLYQTKRDLQLRNQALEELSQELEAKSQLIETELSEASNYLRSLLPKPYQGKLEIDYQFIPSLQLGGDLFDYCWLDPEFLMFYLLDVSGHGLAAALPAISTFNLLRTQAFDKVSFYQPNQVLAALNEAFILGNHSDDRYFTIWYGVYNLEKKQLVYASAGHPPAVLVTADRVQTLRTKGLPIGMIPNAKYVNQFCSIEDLSKLYLFSDGVYEFYQADRSLFDLESFIKLLQPKPSLSEVVDLLQVRNVDRDFPDDFSLLQVSFD